MILSDLFDDLDAIMKGIERLRFQKHEVVLFNLWDPWERDLPLEGHCKFHDLETGEILTTQADGVRTATSPRCKSGVTKWKPSAATARVDRVELTTDDGLEQALLDYLVRRAKSF